MDLTSGDDSLALRPAGADDWVRGRDNLSAPVGHDRWDLRGALDGGSGLARLGDCVGFGVLGIFGDDDDLAERED